MSLSGSITTGYWTSSDSGQTRGYTLSWTATQSIANNQSTISWTLSTAGTYPYTVAERTLYVVLAGNVLVNKTDRVMRGAGTVASGSFTVGHDSSGNCSISGSIQAAVYTSSVNCTGSGNWSLNNIPRQANITSAPDFNDKQNPTITYSNPAGTAVTSLQACISLTGAKDDIAYRDISKTGTSYTFNLTEDERNVLRNATPNSTSMTVTFFVITVIGGNTFYSTLKKTFTISEDAIPTATVTLSDDDGHFDKYGKYVQGQSRVNISISANGIYGSTIKSYKTTFDGKTFSDSDFVTDVINGSGTMELEVTVKDSRGRDCIVKKTIDVYEYKRPKITSLKSKRCQQYNINLAGDGYLGVLFDAEVTDLNEQNTSVFELLYKKATESNYNVVELQDYENQYTVSGESIFQADKDSYNIILRITDDFGTVEKKITGPSISVLISKLRYNLGLAFGKLAELEGVFDIGFKTRFSGGIMQLILEEGKDLNEVLLPNTYAGREVSQANYLNLPEGVTEGKFTLMVIGCGDGEEVKQTLVTCDKEDYQTYERFYYDGEWGTWVNRIAQLNSKFIITEEGTAIVYANGFVEQFGHAVLPNANDYVAQKEIVLPIAIDIDKDYAITVSRNNQGNGIWGINSAVSCHLINDKKVLISLQNPNAGYDVASDYWRTVQWHVIGFASR